MSHRLISLNEDLQRLQNDGYEVEIRSNHLLIHAVPYLNAARQLARGTLVSDLSLAGERTIKPANHVAYFIGEHPCKQDGTPILTIKHASNRTVLAPDIEAQHSFSNKPAGGYQNYYEKMTRYIEIITNYASAVQPSITARTYKVVTSDSPDEAFQYTDTSSTRSGITALSALMATQRIAIVGVGGTGSYILDLVAKTPVREIHLYDGDVFLQHNAFRAPGAAPIEILRAQPTKVQYFKEVYSRIHKGIVAHQGFINEGKISDLESFDFVFICIDSGASKKAIVQALQSAHTSFIDVGMGVEIIEGNLQLIGVCRVTASTEIKSNHVESRISFSDNERNDLYRRNIQIADLNALNAALAVIKWKKLIGFYQDLEQEHHATYSTNLNLLTSDETP